MKQFIYGAVVGYLFHLIMASTFAHAEETPLLVIDGVITESSVAPISAELERRIEKNDHSIVDILINSPGGSVLAGQSLINQIVAAKDKKFRVNCYTSDMAASMAFYIFTQCSARYALPGSFLLWHGARVETSGIFTEKSAKELSESLGQLDLVMISQLFSTLHMKADVIMENFHKETLWSGLSLQKTDPKFLTLKSSYPALTERLSKAIRSDHSLFGKRMRQEDDGVYTCTWAAGVDQ